MFAEFEEEAFAAASIGQVHRAVTRDGRAVAVKVQYPGVAEAVDTDLRNLTLLLPLVKRLAPGLDVKAIYAELRERIAEELDYELEAQNHRAVARAHRGHPFAHVPEVHTELSSRRVLVTDLLRGARFEAVKALDDARPATASPRSCSASTSGSCTTRAASRATRTRATTCCSTTGASGFLDFGLMRVLDRAYLDREAAVARRDRRRRRRDRARGCSPSSATCPSRRRSSPRRCSRRSRRWGSGTWSRARAASRPRTSPS